VLANSLELASKFHLDLFLSISVNKSSIFENLSSQVNQESSFQNNHIIIQISIHLLTASEAISEFSSFEYFSKVI
jgi:hypothetical protein